MRPSPVYNWWQEGPYWFAWLGGSLGRERGPFVDEFAAKLAFDTHKRDPKLYVTGHGQVVTNVHQETADCAFHGCVIHSPTDVRYPTLWRQDDRVLMEMVCPHGVGHPHPDHINWVRRTHGEDVAKHEAVHGCDGCCAPGIGIKASGGGAKPEEVDGVLECLESVVDFAYEHGYHEHGLPLVQIIREELTRLRAALAANEMKVGEEINVFRTSSRRDLDLGG